METYVFMIILQLAVGVFLTWKRREDFALIFTLSILCAGYAKFDEGGFLLFVLIITGARLLARVIHSQILDYSKPGSSKTSADRIFLEVLVSELTLLFTFLVFSPA